MFDKLRIFIIRQLGGIMPSESFKDAVKRVKEADEAQAKELFHEIAVKQLNFVSREHIFRKKRDGAYLAGERLTPEQARKIEKDAETFQDSLIWQALKREIDYVAYQNGFVNARTEDDMFAGKMLVYLKDLIDQKLRQLRG